MALKAKDDSMLQAGKAGIGTIVFAGLFLLIAAPAASAEECTGHSSEPLVGLLQPPPCETCEETKAELAELAALEQSRTPEQADHAGKDAERSLARFLAGAGIAFDADTLKGCEVFFVTRRKDEVAALEAAKGAFCRHRPFATPGNTLHPLDSPSDSYSYPSGHSTYGATTGFLLAAMMPEKRDAIYARVNDYARSRMVAGVHFRSDVEAGKLFGSAIANVLFAKPGFQAEFEEAKACVRKAAGL
jgi:acid phosphatase (class A)